MKKNIRGKIKQFLESEDGRVSTKVPLTLGVATGSLLLAQAMIPNVSQALHFDFSGVTCEDDSQCTTGEVCAKHEHEDNGTVFISTECVNE